MRSGPFTQEGCRCSGPLGAAEAVGYRVPAGNNFSQPACTELQADPPSVLVSAPVLTPPALESLRRMEQECPRGCEKQGRMPKMFDTNGCSVTAKPSTAVMQATFGLAVIARLKVCHSRVTEAAR